MLKSAELFYTDPHMGFNSSTRRKHSKPGSTVMRAFHFRLELSPLESQKLHAALSLSCDLKNKLVVMLEDSRKEARAAKLRGEEPHYLSAFDLKKQVAAKCLEPRFLALHSQVRQDLSMRVIEGQNRWFEALKEGRRHVRPPSPMSRKDFRSITYPQYGTAAKITQGKLHVSKLGEFRVLGWRKMRGAKKSVTIKFKEGHFWAIVMCAVQESNVCRPYKKLAHLPEAGVDPGITSVLTDSFGKSYDTPKPLQKAASKLRHIQKNVSRKFEVRKNLHLKTLGAARDAARQGGDAVGAKAPVAAGLVESLRDTPYSNRLRRNIKKLAKAHTKVERIRKEVARKNARKLEKRYSRVAVEEHGLVFIQRNRRMSKSASDVAIGKQKEALRSALGSGRYFKADNRRAEGGNSQTCLCGAKTPKTLGQRWHTCPECALEGPRDQVSAIIVQHTTFGSVPRVDNNSVPGLGILEQAVRLLEIRRGESKRGSSESCASRRSAPCAPASEPSVKRPAPRRRGMRNTPGEATAASGEVNTTGYTDLIRSCPVATKARMKNPRLPILNRVVSLCEKHPPSGG